MYKSVFAKYITAFMLIIVVAFMILAGIISSMMQSHSDASTEDTLKRSAQNVKLYMEQGFSSSGYESYDAYIKGYSMGILRDISTLAMFTNEAVILYIDSDGSILLSNIALSHPSVNAITMQNIIESGNLFGSGFLDGVFNDQYSYYALPIYNGSRFEGAIFACASEDSMNQLVQDMMKTLIISSLWIMLAALIAVYFITEKIIGPLKQMSRAAKSFASGHFDVRVPVIGNDEVAELAVAFNNMATSLASYEDMRRTFLANVSHDLRTPMFNIGATIDSILAGAIPPEKYNYYFDIIAQEVRRLSRLVSSLLDISRIQAGDRKFNYEPFDVCEMARQILISFEQKINNKNLDVEFDCEEDRMYVNADHDAIYQILFNLCDNAVKFAREGGKYKISLLTKDRKVHVSVYNEGEGISSEDMPYVFERFYKADKSRGLDKTGSGLGLYISKTIINAHNERIWCKSELGQYCSFTFTLQPTSEQAYKASQEAKHAAAKAAAEGMKSDSGK